MTDIVFNVSPPPAPSSAPKPQEAAAPGLFAEALAESGRQAPRQDTSDSAAAPAPLKEIVPPVAATLPVAGTGELAVPLPAPAIGSPEVPDIAAVVPTSPPTGGAIAGAVPAQAPLPKPPTANATQPPVATAVPAPVTSDAAEPTDPPTAAMAEPGPAIDPPRDDAGKADAALAPAASDATPPAIVAGAAPVPLPVDASKAAGPDGSADKLAPSRREQAGIDTPLAGPMQPAGTNNPSTGGDLGNGASTTGGQASTDVGSTIAARDQQADFAGLVASPADPARPALGPDGMPRPAFHAGSAIRTDAATTDRIVANGPPVDQVAVHLGRAASNGDQRIQIQLNPGDLGRVDIRLELQDGRATAHISADRPETMAQLQRDSSTLDRALQDAGFKTDSTSLNFNLRDGQQRGTPFNGRNPAIYPQATTADSALPPATLAASYLASGSATLNIVV